VNSESDLLVLPRLSVSTLVVQLRPRARSVKCSVGTRHPKVDGSVLSCEFASSAELRYGVILSGLTLSIFTIGALGT